MKPNCRGSIMQIQAILSQDNPVETLIGHRVHSTVERPSLYSVGNSVGLILISEMSDGLLSQVNILLDVTLTFIS